MITITLERSFITLSLIPSTPTPIRMQARSKTKEKALHPKNRTISPKIGTKPRALLSNTQIRLVT